MNVVPAPTRPRKETDLPSTLAVQRVPRRDRAVRLVGSTVHVWPVPARPDALRVRRVRLDAPPRRAPDGPGFGGDDEPKAPATRRSRPTGCARFKPTPRCTPRPRPCAARRMSPTRSRSASPARTSRPASTRRIGRAWMAPFGDRRADISDRTLARYDKAARHLVAWVREVDVGHFDRDTVERYRDHQPRESASPSLIAQELRVCSMAWRWASLGAMVPARAPLTAPVKVEGYVLNHHNPEPAEVRKVINAACGEARLAIELLAITGARVSDVANLRRCDIAVDGKRVHLRLSSKTGTRRFPPPEPIAKTKRPRGGSRRCQPSRCSGRRRTKRSGRGSRGRAVGRR